MSGFAFPTQDALRIARTALAEDLGGLDGVDVTTEATIDPSTLAVANIVARAPGVVAGLPVIDLVLSECAAITGGAPVLCEIEAVDGSAVRPGDVLAILRGPAATILTAERTILNILSRHSEPATPHSIVTSEDRMLRHPPVADCARYDLLRGYDAAA